MTDAPPARGPQRWDRFADVLVRRRAIVLVVWLVALVAILPAAVGYGHYLSYSMPSTAPSGSPSEQAASLLAKAVPQYSTLIAAVPVPSGNLTPLAGPVLDFESAVAQAGIAYYHGSTSVYSSAAAYVDYTYGPTRDAINGSRLEVTTLSSAVYGFPAAFLVNWSSAGGTLATVNASFAASGGTPSGYEEAFRATLVANFSPTGSPETNTQRSVETAAPSWFAPSPTLDVVLAQGSVVNYTGAIDSMTASVLELQFGSPFPLSVVHVAPETGDLGTLTVRYAGLTGLPTFLSSGFVSPDGSLQLVLLTFNVTEQFRGPNNFYPAQEATPALRALLSEYLGTNASLAGLGAVAYDTAQAQSGSGILFALTFVFLAVAVALTLRSWIAPILALVFVSIATLLGYAMIVATGLLLGSVDNVVTYTLTAVTLGIATDYLVFLLYRYREELRAGADRPTAIRTAASRGSFAILASSLTVAVGLGSLAFLTDLRSWGPVLFGTVLAIGVLEATLLPVVVSYLGPRLFRAAKADPHPRPVERSLFYRSSDLAARRYRTVLAICVVVGLPLGAFFVLVPTTYDFSQSLPSAYPSVQAQNQITEAFGANVLFPAYVIVAAPTGGFLAPNGSVTSGGAVELQAAARAILNVSGVTAVEGPFVRGTAITSDPGSSEFIFENGSYAYYVVSSNLAPYSAGAIQMVTELRATDGFLVGGVTSTVIDQKAANDLQFGELELILALFVGVVLALSFRSWRYPLVSLTGVLLSVFAATAVLYAIVRFLFGQSLIFLIPLILFVILLSLGNDYSVFIFARLDEERRRAPGPAALPRAIAASGVVVTSLGIILAVSLGSLAVQPMAFLQQIGIAFIVSLLLDTFVIRLFFVPAALRGLRAA